MKKWIWIISSIVFMSVAISTVIYTKAREPLKTAIITAEDRAKTEAGIISVEKFYLYHGAKTYYTIIGKDSDGILTAVWIPENKKQELVIKKMSEGISEQEALNKLLQEEAPSEILSVKLGMEKGLPVWELAYLDEKSNLNYYYIHFESGKWWRKIKNL